MPEISLPDWYQLDFVIQNSEEDLKEITTLIKRLESEGFTSRWFFLWEGTTIRIRFQSAKGYNELKGRVESLSSERGLEINGGFPFSQYEEEIFPNEEVMRGFANIMSEATQLSVKKINGETNFENYRILERISHCLFNNIAGLAAAARNKPEEHFLLQRLRERCGQGFDSDLEK